MRTPKWMAVALVLVSLTALVGGAAAAPAAREDVTLTVWGFVWTADWLDAIAPGFEAEHPGVTVNVERFEYDAYRDAIITALASGSEVPNVATLDPMWAGDLIRDGALAPLEGVEEQLNPDDFVAGGWELCQDQGVQYGVPADLDFNLLFYRKDVYGPAIEQAGLDHFPATTDEFLQVAELISDENTKAILLYQSDYYTWYQGFLVPYGGRIIKDGRYAFADDDAVAALQLYNDLVNKYHVGLMWDWDVDGDPMVALKNGEALAIMHGSWYATELEAAAPEMEGQWGVAKMPFGPEDRKVHAATGGACFSIPVAADHQDLAYQFLLYAEQPEIMATYYDIVGGVPSLQTAWDYIDLEAPNEYLGVPLAKLVAEWSSEVVGMELPSTEVADALGEAIYMVTAEGVDPKEALEAAVEASPPLD